MLKRPNGHHMVQMDIMTGALAGCSQEPRAAGSVLPLVVTKHVLNIVLCFKTLVVHHYALSLEFF